MDWLMKYSECKDTGLRVCEVYEHLLVREDGMVKNISGHHACKKEWWEGNVTSKNYRNIRIPGTKNDIRVHRAVALAFIDNPLNYTECNHIDHNTTNNTVNNIEWCNRRMNCSMKLIHNTKLVGASWDKERGKWSSWIRHNKKRKFLGRYDTEQCAHDAYIAYKALHNII